MNSIILKLGRDKKIKKGYPWVLREDCSYISPDIKNGQIVRIVSEHGRNFGLAFYSENKRIAARLLYVLEKFTKEELTEKISEAKKYREAFFSEEESYRLVFSESDKLPGLIIDKYSAYFSVQILSYGMYLFKEIIKESLLGLYPNCSGIIVKSNSLLKEDLIMETDEILYGKIPNAIDIVENNIKYKISLTEGQKTGYFLDQKLNRAFLAKLSKGKRVLDCFTNQGGFAFNAALNGASYVKGIDISEKAVELCKANAILNNLRNVEFEKADVFEYLKGDGKNEDWDIIVLDPPSFTKSRQKLAQAKRGYAQINRFALRLLKPGSFLISCSCSGHMTENLLSNVIEEEAARAGKQLQLIYRGMQSPDHPVLQVMPETNYLKCLVFRVI